LRQAGFIIERHRDHFSHDAADVVWIRAVSQREWVILTLDKRISRTDAEKHAVLDARARVIALSAGKATLAMLAENVIRSKAPLTRFIKKHDAPFFAVLSRPDERARQRGKPGTLRKKF